MPAPTSLRGLCLGAEKKLEARKMPVNRAREASHTSVACFVWRTHRVQGLSPETERHH